MKPISATKANECDHCTEGKIQNLAGQLETRFKCSFQTDGVTYKQACTMNDWLRCTYNEDK